MEIEGTPARGAAGDVIARETNAFYCGLGTPEVLAVLAAQVVA